MTTINTNTINNATTSQSATETKTVVTKHIAAKHPFALAVITVKGIAMILGAVLMLTYFLPNAITMKKEVEQGRQASRQRAIEVQQAIAEADGDIAGGVASVIGGEVYQQHLEFEKKYNEAKNRQAQINATFSW